MLVEGALSVNLLQCGLRTWEVAVPGSASLAKLQTQELCGNVVKFDLFEPGSLLSGNLAGECYAWRYEGESLLCNTAWQFGLSL